eukprot:g49119.t1
MTGKPGTKFLARWSRPVLCVETGEIYGSMAEAGRAVQRSGGAVKHAITMSGKCAGYSWQFVDEDQRDIPRHPY